MSQNTPNFSVALRHALDHLDAAEHKHTVDCGNNFRVLRNPQIAGWQQHITIFTPQY